MVRRNLLLAFIICMGLLSGCGQTAGQDQPAPQEAPKKVATTEQKQDNSQQVITISGKIEAVQSANLVSKVPGKVEAVRVDLGSTVRAGQVLVSLSAEDKVADIEEANTTVESAQVEYQLAKRTYERGQELISSQAISQADFDNQYEGPFQRAEVRLKAAQASVKKKQIAYADMQLKAPFSGVITAKSINPGEMAGTQTLLTLTNLNQVVVKGIVNENQINQLKQGQTVQVMVKAASAQPFTGRISNIGLSADAQGKGFPIKVQVDNPNFILKPGMFAEVIIK